MKEAKVIIKFLVAVVALAGAVAAIVCYREKIEEFFRKLKEKCCCCGKLFSCCKFGEASDFEDI